MTTRAALATPAVRHARLHPVLITLALVLTAAPVAAQSSARSGRHDASFALGGSFGDGGTALASSLGVTLRLTERLGIATELAHARKLDFTFDLCPAPLVCVRGGHLPVTGRTVSLVPHLVVDLPTPGAWRVYLQAGAGAGHIRQRWFDNPRTSTGSESTRSSLVAAMSFGGGTMVQVAPRLALGVDVRSLHLADDDPTPRFLRPSGRLGTLRVGVRVSWLF